MEPKYFSSLIEESYSSFERMKSGIRKAGLVALVVAIIGVGVYGCNKEGLKEEDTVKLIALEDELYKQTKIAFQSYRDGNFEIYIMNADGSEPTRLTNDSADDVMPSWSPDGKKIAFQSTRDGNFEVYIMNADGSKQTRLTNNPAFDCMPSWSPDGKKIAFSSERDGHTDLYVKTDVYVMNTDGSKQTRLTNNSAMCSSCSPDGEKIAFYSLVKDGNEEKDNGEEATWWYELNMEIYIMNPDGSEQTNLTNNSAYDGYPSWSPFLVSEK